MVLGTKAKAILEILRATDRWLDRNEIAAAMGRNRLNPHDIDMLEVLVSEGLIERNTQVSGITEKWVYRTAPQED